MPIVNFPFYDPKSGPQPTNPFDSGSLAQAGAGIGQAVANLPFRKQQIKQGEQNIQLGDQKIAANALMQKQREEADRQASEAPEKIGFRYEFHIEELTEQFNNMEEGKVRDKLRQQIGQLKNRRDYFYKLGKDKSKLSPEEVKAEHTNLEKLYHGFGESIRLAQGRILSTGQYEDHPELLRSLTEIDPFLTGKEIGEFPGTKAQAIEDKQRAQAAGLRSKEGIEQLKETGRTERAQLRAGGRTGGLGEERLQFQREKSLQPLYNQRDENLRKMKENQGLIDQFRKEGQVKKGTDKFDQPIYYTKQDIKKLEDEIFSLTDENKSIEKRVETLGLGKGSSQYLGVERGVSTPTGEVTQQAVQTPSGTLGVERQATPAGEQVQLKAGINLNNLAETRDLITRQAEKAQDKTRVTEILKAIEMIEKGDENQAATAAKLLETKYPQLYQILKGTP